MTVLPIIASSIVVVISFIISLCILHAIPTSGSTVLGFSAKLIHRDSPESPLYDPTSTPSSRFRAAVHRSARRGNYLRNISANSRLKNIDGISGDIINCDGDYMVAIEIGGQIVHLVMDTGSGGVWVLWEPCNDCHEHDGPIFDRKASSTFKDVMCKSDACSLLPHSPCDDNSKCPFSTSYADGSFASGVYGIETIAIKSPFENYKVVVPGIGIGFANVSKQFNIDIIGIAGFNSKKFSLPRQLNSTIGIHNMFSYCLPENDGVFSEIHFGSTAVVSDPRAMTTPMFIDGKGFYYLNLKKIHIADKVIRPLHLAKKREKVPHSMHAGNIIIDSGTTLSYIPGPDMKRLSKEVEKLIPMRRVKPPEDLSKIVELCFNWTGSIEEKLMLPTVTFVFAGNVRLRITKPFHLYYDIYLCFTIASSDPDTDEMPILGTYAHQTYRTVYKPDKRELTFIPKAC